MRNRFKWVVMARGSVAVVAVLSLTLVATTRQSRAYKAPWTADGKPNLNGI